MKRIAYLLICFFTVMNVQAQGKKPVPKKVVVKPVPKVAKPMPVKIPVIAGNTKVKITTDSGEIVIRLYDRTPKHRDNFIKLVKQGFYDSLLFHRVISAFMIQGGDPNSKNAEPGQPLGMGDVGYTVPAEFDSLLFHKKGALAAARQGDEVNPLKASSGCQFYIVQGRAYNDQELGMMEMQMGKKFSAAKKSVYKTLGGTPFLDMGYTVFGEVVSGLKVIDKIASVPGDGYNRPLGNIRMKMELLTANTPAPAKPKVKPAVTQ